jgi:predicted RNA-binding Zn-ribbon protein involved in translation (DUF1610 family)
MTEQEIIELRDKYNTLVPQAAEAQRTACKLNGELYETEMALVRALKKLFVENEKYHCRQCGGAMELQTKPHRENDDSYYMWCSKCGSRGPMFHDDIVALLEWMRMCNNWGDEKDD